MSTKKNFTFFSLKWAWKNICLRNGTLNIINVLVYKVSGDKKTLFKIWYYLEMLVLYFCKLSMYQETFNGILQCSLLQNDRHLLKYFPTYSIVFYLLYISSSVTYLVVLIWERNHNFCIFYASNFEYIVFLCVFWITCESCNAHTKKKLSAERKWLCNWIMRYK